MKWPDRKWSGHFILPWLYGPNSRLCCVLDPVCIIGMLSCTSTHHWQI